MYFIVIEDAGRIPGGVGIETNVQIGIMISIVCVRAASGF
jgi:hypothetical protein